MCVVKVEMYSRLLEDFGDEDHGLARFPTLGLC